MCLLRGILLGVLLTVGGAYVYDSVYSKDPANLAQARTLVNWDVVGVNLQALAVRIHHEWDKLIS